MLSSVEQAFVGGGGEEIRDPVNTPVWGAKGMGRGAVSQKPSKLILKITKF